MTSEDFRLRTYTFEEGPPYPTGRRKGELMWEFIRRKQVEELRRGAKNIFAPVNMTYTPGADRRRQLAAELRRRGPRVDSRDVWTIYNEALRLKAAA